MQSPAPSKKTASEFGALAISMLEAQCGSPRGNFHHPAVSGRSQRLRASFFHYTPPQGDPPGVVSSLFTLLLMSLLQSQCYLPPEYKAATASARAGFWMQQSGLHGVLRPVLCTQRAHGHAQGRLEAALCQEELGLGPKLK